MHLYYANSNLITSNEGERMRKGEEEKHAREMKNYLFNAIWPMNYELLWSSLSKICSGMTCRLVNLNGFLRVQSICLRCRWMDGLLILERINCWSFLSSLIVCREKVTLVWLAERDTLSCKLFMMLSGECSRKGSLVDYLLKSSGKAINLEPREI